MGLGHFCKNVKSIFEPENDDSAAFFQEYFKIYDEMKSTKKKYDFYNVEQISGIEFKWSMGATAVVILNLWGWLNVGPAIFTIISLFSWWSFRRYFTRVGDKVTGNLIFLIMLVIGLYGFTITTLRSIFSLEFFIQLASSEAIMFLFKGVFIAIAILSIAVFIGCTRILAVNRHHSFPLKRIAISTAISIPIFIIIGVIGSLTFISQFGGLLYDSIPERTLYTDGNEYFYLPGDIGEGGDMIKSIFGDLFSVFSFILSPFVFIYKVIIVLPYLFLFFHFYKMDKRNSRKEVLGK